MSAVLKQSKINFRPMSEADIERVGFIEKDAYEFPWTLDLFQDCVKIGYCCSVLEQDGKVLGYGVMYAAAQEAHILNICITPDLHNNGLGQVLLDHLLDLATAQSASVIFLEVRPSNQPALKIYRRAGFSIVGQRRDYYPTKFGREDALVLVKQLIDSSV